MALDMKNPLPHREPWLWFTNLKKLRSPAVYARITYMDLNMIVDFIEQSRKSMGEVAMNGDSKSKMIASDFLGRWSDPEIKLGSEIEPRH